MFISPTQAGTQSKLPVTSLDGSVSYTYDSKNQLTAESSTRGSGISTTFAFDSVGNPTTFQGVTKSFNNDNQLTGTGMSYDGNGNPTSYGGASMTFDAENKLTAAGSAMTAGYTIEELRAWKQNMSSGVRTYFLYDGTMSVIELTSGGSVSATNTFGANGLLSRNVSGSGSIFYTFDERGNVAQRLSSSGSILSTDLYSAFGTLLAGGGDVFGFGGKAGYYTDIETGFVLCTFRCYDPINGRWITRDPASYSGGINLYGYCQNMVVSGMDPSGKGIGLIVGLGPLLAVLCSLACQQMSNEDGDPCEIDQCTTICDEIAETAQIASCLVLMFLPPPVDMAAVITCILIAIAGLMKLNLDMTGEAHHCGCPFANTSVVSATPAGNPVTPSLA